MVLFLMKHSRPDFANAIRELMNANDGTNSVAFQELLHVIRYLLDTKIMGEKVESTRNASKPWEKVCLSDSD